MERHKSIGIFDSGVGGLSIAEAINELLPEENLVYFADIGFSPYGNKSTKIIKKRSKEIVKFLISQNCKLVVVACNTATVNSISNLRAETSIPIIGVEPAIKPAALQSKTGIIGVLATKQTIASRSFQNLRDKYSEKVSIKTKACPKFVTLVESLNHNSEQARTTAEQYIQPLLSQNCDQIVLGCTHFSFLKTTIENIVGLNVNIIDTAVPVAKEVKNKLQSNNLENTENTKGIVEFWVSGNSAQASESINELWEKDVKVSSIQQITPT
ncbi:glutamate racemase [Colwellia sp. E150_009]